MRAAGRHCAGAVDLPAADGVQHAVEHNLPVANVNSLWLPELPRTNRARWSVPGDLMWRHGRGRRSKCPGNPRHHPPIGPSPGLLRCPCSAPCRAGSRVGPLLHHIAEAAVDIELDRDVREAGQEVRQHRPQNPLDRVIRAGDRRLPVRCLGSRKRLCCAHGVPYACSILSHRDIAQCSSA